MTHTWELGKSCNFNTDEFAIKIAQIFDEITLEKSSPGKLKKSPGK